ncbi:ABC-type transport auxiliary lipoprotein family protein [Lentilitoribacter sp. Alg239-R112]|uniref:ABC-type transport auxiliary lipoprotein family protein n=1 Tax=Lentilitoribacter sp. Alg239-R112 TaxID=2305987 RepID=UPI0013A6DA68|nr:ABC-type transport auxiliary lipoprotein family protein [Lentilitoribacter sp. Alg239-R112]
MRASVFMLRKILALTTCLALSGCIGGGNASIPDTFTLAHNGEISTPGVRSRRQILITEPSALKTLDSEQILVRTSPSAVQYLSKAQWNDRLPKVFQVKLARAFENSGRLSGVGLPGEGLAIDYQVVTSLRSFEVVASSPRVAVAEVSVKILNDRNGTVRAQKVFRQITNVVGNSNEAYVDSLNSASSQVISDIVTWSLKYVR